MADEWYYQRNDQQFGPVTSATLRQMALNGLLWPIDLVTKAGMTTWVEASKIKGLFTTNQAQPTLKPQPGNALVSTNEQGISSSPPPIPTQPNEPFPFTDTATKTPISQKPVRSSLGSALFSGLLQPVKPTPEPEPSANISQAQAANVPILPRLPAELDPSAIMIEHPTVYQGGHPALHQKSNGRLILSENAIFFIGETASCDLFFPFDSIRDLMKPSVGSYPQKMIDQANSVKAMADIGKGVAKFAGTWMGGSDGRLVKATGGAGSDLAKGTTSLGAPPKNRLTIVFLDSSKYPHKVFFDVSGSSKVEMEQRAEGFWMRISPFRPKFASLDKPKNTNKKSTGYQNSSFAGSFNTNGEYRILSPGQPLEVLSGQDLNQKLAEGQVSPGALVCIEFWVPIHLAASFGVFGHMGGLNTGGINSKENPNDSNEQGIDGSGGNNNPSLKGKSPKNRGSGARTAIAAGVAGAVVGAVAGAALSSAMRKRKDGSGINADNETEDLTEENELPEEDDDSTGDEEGLNDNHEEQDEEGLDHEVDESDEHNEEESEIDDDEQNDSDDNDDSVSYDSDDD